MRIPHCHHLLPIIELKLGLAQRYWEEGRFDPTSRAKPALGFRSHKPPFHRVIMGLGGELFVFFSAFLSYIANLG